MNREVNVNRQSLTLTETLEQVGNLQWIVDLQWVFTSQDDLLAITRPFTSKDANRFSLG
jgi:nitrate reductase NapAB chaperone NapD